MKTKLSLIFGFAFGLLDVLLMIPLNMPDKAVAIAGAFFNRFAIGFIIPNTNLPVSPWLKGLFIGLLLSLPDAIITKAYAPILGVGIVGGILIGVISDKLERRLKI